MIPGGINPMLLSGNAGYQIDRSLRFRNSASAYLSRTATAGNTKRFTLAFWMKRGALVDRDIISSKLTGGSYPAFSLGFDGDRLRAWDYSGSAFTLNLYTTALFRDPTAWMLVTLAVDTTQATASNRVRLYINDKEITSFSTATYPALNADLNWNAAGSNNTIGGQSAGGYGYFDGYLANVMHVNDQQLTPFSFAQYDPNGQLQAKLFAGSFGSNGWWLDFSNPASLTTLGTDRSGNGNNWTATNVSLTAGVTYDSMLDVPLGSGGSERGNYATLNPLKNFTSLSAGNLNALNGSGVHAACVATIYVSTGKWYWEATVSTGNSAFGIAKESFVTASGVYVGSTSESYAYYFTGDKYNNGASAAYGAALASGDTVGVALDLAAGTLTFYKNGVSQGVAYSGLSGEFAPAISLLTADSKVNFGQRPFAYTPPAGFKALHTGNLPEPVITQPNQHFDVVTQLGSAVSTGAALLSQKAYTYELAWGKDRAAANNHQLVDTVRGSTAVLQSNSTGAETTYTGPTVGDNCVSWHWNAASAAVTNNAGSISAQVSANPAAGFSIATYTGTGVAGTVGHGLGVAPKMMIVKRRNSVVAWTAGHSNLDSSIPWGYFLNLNSSNGRAGAASIWNDTAPTSSAFAVGTDAGTNAAAGTYVAYCFAEIPGYSKLGSYTGNGNSDGPFVFCGFRPRFLMVKRVDTGGTNWQLIDTARDGFNNLADILAPNSNATELIDYLTVNLLSNGFKLGNLDTSWNASGGTYIFAAFAEAPFKTALAR